MTADDALDDARRQLWAMGWALLGVAVECWAPKDGEEGLRIVRRAHPRKMRRKRSTQRLVIEARQAIGNRERIERERDEARASLARAEQERDAAILAGWSGGGTLVSYCSMCGGEPTEPDYEWKHEADCPVPALLARRDGITTDGGGT